MVIPTVKGAVSLVPVVGGLISEYIGLTTDLIAAKRLKEWQDMVEEKLLKIECDISEIANNDFFYSCVQTATVGALKSYQTEKRKLFANALYNSYILPDITEEKKIIFISLIDKYTLLTIKLLQCYSKDNYEKYDARIYKENNPDPNNKMRTYTNHGTEKPIKYLCDEIPELAKDPQLAKTLAAQLKDDGLIEPIDFDMPTHPETNRRKRTTNLGDEFLVFILQNK